MLCVCVCVQSNNEQVYGQHLQNKLLPDHTYSVVSGGEPLAIPDLTWEQLKQFHATHYHPSNARYIFHTHTHSDRSNHPQQSATAINKPLKLLRPTTS